MSKEASSAIDSLTAPRDRILVLAGRIDGLSDVIKILSDQAGDADAAGKALIGDILGEIRDIMDDAVQENVRRSREIMRAEAWSLVSRVKPLEAE